VVLLHSIVMWSLVIQLCVVVLLGAVLRSGVWTATVVGALFLATAALAPTLAHACSLD